MKTQYQIPKIGGGHTFRFQGGNFLPIPDPFNPDDSTPTKNGYRSCSHIQGDHFEYEVFQSDDKTPNPSFWVVEFSDYDYLCYLFVSTWPDLIQLLVLLNQAVGKLLDSPP